MEQNGFPSKETSGERIFNFIFWSQNAAKSIHVVYSSIDGVLFDAKKETLMFYPLGKTTQIYTVPDSCVI